MRLITGAVKEINRLGKLGLFQTHMQDLHVIWGIRGGNAKNKSSGRIQCGDFFGSSDFLVQRNRDKSL